MSEFDQVEFTPAEHEVQMDDSPSGCSSTVAIAAIVAFMIVSLACIMACTISMYAFLSNPPW